MFSGMLSGIGLLIIFNNFRRCYARMIGLHIGVTAALLTTLLLARPYIEPWVSCEAISKVFNSIDQSDTPVLASKFYGEGSIHLFHLRPSVEYLRVCFCGW